MIVSRGPLLAALNIAKLGTSNKDILEQSSSYVFKGEWAYAFNDEIMCRVKSPFDFDAVVNASDFLGILGKIPDDEVDISLRTGEIRIKGKKRTAGITCTTDVHLPIDAVPRPEDWKRVADGAMAALQQAAKTCGQDETQYLTTCVHVLPDKVTACDNHRLLRVDGPTGFPKEVLIPASSLSQIEGLDIAKVSQGDGWVHFRTGDGAEISLRCSHEKYHNQIDALFEMDDAEKMTLPANLGEIVERAEIFHTAAYDARIGVSIGDGGIKITSRKDGGWYREKRRIRYDGKPLDFEINPKFLVEVLKRTRDVLVNSRKIKIEYDRIRFVVSLVAKPRTDEDDADTQAVTEAKPEKSERTTKKAKADSEEFDEADIPF